MDYCLLALVIALLNFVNSEFSSKDCCDDKKDLTTAKFWEEAWSIYPTTTTWSMQATVPMITEISTSGRQGRGKYKVKKKYRKFFLPLLLAYKLKFFTLIPVLIGGLVLLTGATGLAGFFFALFAAVMGLKSGSGHRTL